MSTCRHRRKESGRGCGRGRAYWRCPWVVGVGRPAEEGQCLVARGLVVARVPARSCLIGCAREQCAVRRPDGRMMGATHELRARVYVCVCVCVCVCV